MILPITLTFAAAATLLNIWIAARVVRQRFASRTLHGDGGHDPLLRRIRAHSNFVEYTPFALILTALLEMAVGSSPWLWIAALVFLAARVLHAFGMDRDRPNRLRASGILLTLLCLLGLTIAALAVAYRGSQAVRFDPLSATV